MKLKVLVIFLILIAAISHAVEITNPPEGQGDAETNAKLTSMQQDIKALQAAVSRAATKEDMDSSFAQLDAKVEQTNQSNVLNYLAFLVGVIIFNDIIVAGLYIILKNKGLLP